MNSFLCSAAFLLLVSLAGCSSAKLFDSQTIPESPAIAEAPWPRLVDTPEAPAKGSYGPGVPDPAAGAAVTLELGLVARAAAGRAEVLNRPVLSEAERRRLTQHR